jgi:folylpolyglutamate synthase/dihydropteroate synthase
VPAQTAADIGQALEMAGKIAGGGPVLVTGSFHTVGAALKELKIEP